MENDLMILKDGTEIKLNYAYDLKNIQVKNITLDELEEKLTDENLSSVEFTKNKSNLYGKYTNLELINLNKDYRTKQITISLQQKASE